MQGPSRPNWLQSRLPEELQYLVVKECTLPSLAALCCVSHELAALVSDVAIATGQLGLFCHLSKDESTRNAQLCSIEQSLTRLHTLLGESTLHDLPRCALGYQSFLAASAETAEPEAAWLELSSEQRKSWADKERKRAEAGSSASLPAALHALKQLHPAVVAIKCGPALALLVADETSEAERVEAIRLLGSLGKRRGAPRSIGRGSPTLRMPDDTSLKASVVAPHDRQLGDLLRHPSERLQAAAIRAYEAHQCLPRRVDELERFLHAAEVGAVEVREAATDTLLTLLPMVGVPSTHGGARSANTSLGSAFSTRGLPNGNELSREELAHLRAASYREPIS